MDGMPPPASFAGLTGEPSRRFRSSNARGCLPCLLDPPIKSAGDEEGMDLPVEPAPGL